MTSYGQDEQVGAEALDGDKVDPTHYPPDEPLGLPDLEGRDVTVIGDHAPDSVAERSGREEPDFGRPGAPAGPGGEAVEIIEPDDAFGADETAEAIAEEAEGTTQFDGAFLTESEDAGDELDSLPAEEAAMHVTDLDGTPAPDVDDLI